MLMTALLCGLAMFAQDFLLTIKSLCANRGKTLLAGLFDMLGGFCVVGTIGISVTAAAQHGLSWYTVCVFVAMGIADFSGAGLGTLLGNKWIHQEDLGPVKKPGYGLPK